MSRKSARAVLLAAVVLLMAGIAVFLIRKPSFEKPPDEQNDTRSPIQSIPRQPTRPRETKAPSEPATTTSPDAPVTALIRSSLEKFSANNDPDQAREILRLLRDGIRQGPEDATAAAILDFLKSGEDTPTKLPFVVGPDGMMDTVPSLRTALLDLLPALDPVSALRLARELMDKRTSPDEYALSLRNLAWNDLDGDLRTELTGRFMDLLATPWVDQPSAGLLESFDIAVEVGGGDVFDKLISLTRGSTAALNQAAFISLDRMILRDPTLLAAASDPAWMDFAPKQRASLLSRLDITQPDQRALFNRYLASTHAAGELDYFAKVFPNGNYLYGHRLVTTDDTTPTIDEVVAKDSAVLVELSALEASAPEEGKAAIAKIRQRLEKSAAGNPEP
ncbi:MAG: hypothetical protein ABIT37_22005 [Luteolibacter sp.]